MSITIRPPAFTDWQCKTGTLTQSGETVTLTGASSLLTCTVTELVPGMPITVRLTVSATGPAPIVIIGTKTIPITNNYQTLVTTVRTDGKLVINLSGAKTATIYKIELFGIGS